MNKPIQPASGTRLSVRDVDVRLGAEIIGLSHADAGAVMLMLSTSSDGLETDEAAARLASGGPNRIDEVLTWRS